MKVLYSQPESASIFCSSSEVPRVVTTIACVSPRVKSAEPWVLGRSPTSHVMFLMSFVPLPSTRTPSFTTISRMMLYFISSKTAVASLSLPGSSAATPAASFLRAPIVE